MRNVRALTFICCFLTGPLSFAQKEDWLPVSPEDLQIKEVPGDAIENPPARQDVRLPFARYEDIIQFNAGQLVTKRVLLLNGIFFPVNQYPELKDFFNKVEAGDEQQAVLHAADASPDKKEAQGPGK